MKTKRPILEIEAALVFVRGNFVAAAKLLDMTPSQLKSVIQYRPDLREKWGKKRRGRPSERLGFLIEPYEPPPEPGSLWAAFQNARLYTAIKALRVERALELLEPAAELASRSAAQNKNDFPPRGTRSADQDCPPAGSAAATKGVLDANTLRNPADDRERGQA